MKPKLAKKQLNAAVNRLRLALKTHGGDLEVVAVRGDVVEIRLVGACRHCPMAAMTFRNAVEKTLLENVRGLKRVQLIA